MMRHFIRRRLRYYLYLFTFLNSLCIISQTLLLTRSQLYHRHLLYTLKYIKKSIIKEATFKHIKKNLSVRCFFCVLRDFEIGHFIFKLSFCLFHNRIIVSLIVWGHKLSFNLHILEFSFFIYCKRNWMHFFFSDEFINISFSQFYCNFIVGIVDKVMKSFKACLLPKLVIMKFPVQKNKKKWKDDLCLTFCVQQRVQSIVLKGKF